MTIIIKSYSCFKCQSRHYYINPLYDKHKAYAMKGVEQKQFSDKLGVCNFFNDSTCEDSRCPFFSGVCILNV